MRTKKTNKNNSQTIPQKKSRKALLWTVIVILALVLVALLLLWWGLYNTQDQPADPQLFANIASQDISVPLGDGMELVKIGSYTGAYVEDGSNEVVSGVLTVTIKNVGAEAIEYAQFSMPAPSGMAQFSVSTLLPGASIVLLEQNRMAYTGQEEFTLTTADVVAVFKQAPKLYEDKLELQVLDGVINVTNISGEDISGDIVIYYKNYVDDLYYGGITFRVRIEGGLKSGEIRQIVANHYSETASNIVFVTIN